MKKILVIHLGNSEEEQTVANILGQDVQVVRIGAGGDIERVRAMLHSWDGKVDAIGLDGYPRELNLAGYRMTHALHASLFTEGISTPLVDGSGVRNSLESWSLILAERAQPGLFSKKRVLMVPGMNHQNLVRGMRNYTEEIRYADPVIYFALPDFPLFTSPNLAARIALPTLEQLKDAPPRRIAPQAGTPGTPRTEKPFLWADVLAGDIGAIRRYAPAKLKRKIVVVEWASAEDLADLKQRGASIVVNLIPKLDGDGDMDHRSAAMIEALLVALRPNPEQPLTENTYLDMVAELAWQPVLHFLQPEDAQVNRFAFVIHPLNVGFIHRHPYFRWTRYLPDELVEAVAAYMPPIYISRITGGQSPTTGQKIEGHLISLAATPRQMMQHSEHFTYRRLNQCARMAERLGARIMGLGAFTSVVGDAGITVAHESDIAITSGNSLTVAATLEAAKQAVVKMGAQDLSQGKAMVVGATGSIGAVCSRLLAQAIYNVVLVAPNPAKLIELKRRILEETPQAEVTIATSTEDVLADCDLIVTTTSAFGQRIIDITRCKPGAVICDVARPPDISADEAALRPDVLVIESGEVLIPGDIDFGYDIGLPPKTAYACLAETALLAMEGRFEDYTLGRNLSIEKVKEIYHLFKKHQFQIAGLRSFGRYVTDDYIAEKRALADALRADPEHFQQVQQQAAAALAKLPPAAKGIRRKDEERTWAWLTAGLALISAILLFRRKK
ncbi:MAG: serine carboxypeptidase [Anaerolineales bacterium]